jgi:hypothetical protein
VSDLIFFFLLSRQKTKGCYLLFLAVVFFSRKKGVLRLHALGRSFGISSHHLKEERGRAEKPLSLSMSLFISRGDEYSFFD